MSVIGERRSILYDPTFGLSMKPASINIGNIQFIPFGKVRLVPYFSESLLRIRDVGTIVCAWKYFPNVAVTS